MAFLIDDLLMSPAKMFMEVCKRIRDMAEDEVYGEEEIKQQLIELEMSLEIGEISQEQYAMAEAALMKRLEEGRRRRGEDQ